MPNNKQIFAFLSFLKRFESIKINHLVEELKLFGLIEQKQDAIVITERGREYLVAYEKLRDILPSLPRLEINDLPPMEVDDFFENYNEGVI